MAWEDGYSYGEVVWGKEDGGESGSLARWIGERRKSEGVREGAREKGQWAECGKVGRRLKGMCLGGSW